MQILLREYSSCDILGKIGINILENGIFELRTKQGLDITRILYFFIVGKKAVLTNGFVKKSQKTPKAEKELARKYRADYERRYGNEQL